jgi:hypothetical protein
MFHRILIGVVSAAAVGTLLAPDIGHAAVEPDAPSQLVTLVSDATLCPSGFSNRLGLRVFPDGSAVPFSIPAGFVLVITDWQWGPVFIEEANHWENAELSLETPQGLTALVAVSGNTTPGAQSNSINNQFTGSNASVQDRIAVKPGVTICIASSSDIRARGVVHGFLTPDR